jgi:hypothetical protein
VGGGSDDLAQERQGRFLARRKKQILDVRVDPMSSETVILQVEKKPRRLCDDGY